MMGARNRPQMSALNLAGLFGGGGQAPANPANVPAPNAQPVSAAGVPGPLARAPLPPIMPPDVAEARRRASMARMTTPYNYVNT
jgi:hypothetical protein